MDYGELRATFKNILNRSDVTDNEADTYIALGLRRAERLLRTPLQSGVYTKTVTSDQSEFIIPNDYLGLIEVRVDGQPYERASYREFVERKPVESFTVNRARFEVYPALGEGSEFELHYYKEFDLPTSVESATNYSLVIPDVVIYAALTYAADTFVDERKGAWEGTVGQLVQEVQAMADFDAMAGGMTIQPMEDIA